MKAIANRRWTRWVAAALLIFPLPVQSATIVVPADCSLSDAIDEANVSGASGGSCPAGDAGADTIELSADIVLTAELPVVQSEVTIEGSGFTIRRDDGASSFRIFDVDPSGDLTVNDATLENGRLQGAGIRNNGFTTLNNTIVRLGQSASEGGGIFNDDKGTLSVNGSTVSDNTAAGRGGGIANNGIMMMTNSTISNNIADGDGGGISNDGMGTIVGSTISGNESEGSGGGIYSDDDLTIRNSTISGNEAADQGGGIANRYGTLTVTNSTVSGNSTAYDGGGIWTFGRDRATITHTTIVGNSAAGSGDGIDAEAKDGSALLLVSSIVANVTTTAGASLGSPTDLNVRGVDANCDGPIVDGGNNFADDSTCPGAAAITPGDDFDAVLAANGGPTRTHALLTGSVAQDAAGLCDLAVDQRGEPRNDGSCDSGSYELGGAGACCTDGPVTQSDCVVLTQADCEADGGMFLGTGSQCTPDIDCMALLVSMEAMSAVHTPAGIEVAWTTGLEIDTVGFRVLRAASHDREKTLVDVSGLIWSTGDSFRGASYMFLDAVRLPGSGLQYFVEDIDVFGKVTRHGPIVVERGSRQRGRQR